MVRSAGDQAGPNDAKLVSQTLSGHREAFEQLIKRYMGAIYAQFSDYVVIEGNTVFDYRTGIRLWDAFRASIRDNTITASENGIYVEASHWVMVERNTITADENGVVLHGGHTATLKYNEMYLSGVLFERGLVSVKSHSIDTTNTINGTPITFIKNRTNVPITVPKGQLLIANCDDCWIEDQVFPTVFYGLQVVHSDRFSISNNVIDMSSHTYIHLEEGGDKLIFDRNTLNNTSIRLWNNYEAINITRNTIREGSIEIEDAKGVINGNIITVTSRPGIIVRSYDFTPRIVNNSITVLNGDEEGFADTE